MRGVLKSIGETAQKVAPSSNGKPRPTEFRCGGKTYRVKQLLGEGAYAFVWLATDAASIGDDVAIKQIVADGSQAQRAAEQEVELMQLVAAQNSAHLGRLLASGKSKVSGTAVEFLMVQEFCPVSLFALMQQHSADGKADGLEAALVMRIVADVAAGLAVLHAAGWTHRDVKPENVLQRNNKWLLVDFGSAMRGTRKPATEAERVAVTDDLASQTTLIYRAPEMLDLFRRQEIGPPADIWALGCTAYYALYLAHPFKDDGELAILNGRLAFPRPERAALRPANEFITRLLAEDPVARPTASETRAMAERAPGALASASSGSTASPARSPRVTSSADRSPRIATPAAVAEKRNNNNNGGGSGTVSPRVGAPANVRKADTSSLDPELQRSIAAARGTGGGGIGASFDLDDSDNDEPIVSRASPRSPAPRKGPPPPPPAAAAPPAGPASESVPVVTVINASTMTAAAAVQRNEEILAEAKQCLAELKAMRDPEMWKMEIAPEVSAAPQPKDVVVRAWQVAARQFSAQQRPKAVQFFALFRSRDKGGDFVVVGRPLDCLQMVSIFHLALQSGSFLAMACGHHCRAFLEDVAAANDNAQGELVKAYAQYLVDRVAFHAKHRVFEGNMSLGTYAMLQFLNRVKMAQSAARVPVAANPEQHLVTTETVKDLLVLLGRAINVQARLLTFKAHASIIPFIIPIVKETFSLTTIISHCLRHYWLPFCGATPPASLLEPFNRSLAWLATHYAEVNTVAEIASTMGPAPPLMAAVPDPRADAAATHPFYAAPSLPYPPSHSPFVVAFEAQRAQALQAAAAQQQQVESLFPASFEAPPVVAPVAAAAPVVAHVVSAPTAEGAMATPETPAVVALAPSFAATFDVAERVTAEEEAEVARFQASNSVVSSAGDTPAQPAPVAAGSTQRSVTPGKDRESKLRQLGSNRRNSIRDINAMREKETAEQTAQLARLLANNSKEELVDEVIFLRKKVAALESQLAEQMLTNKK